MGSRLEFQSYASDQAVAGHVAAEGALIADEEGALVVDHEVHAGIHIALVPCGRLAGDGEEGGRIVVEVRGYPESGPLPIWLR